jgi:hypothetical protein
MTTEEAFNKLYKPLSILITNAGYALAIHGSLRRDIDMVIIPWREELMPVGALMACIVDKIKELNNHALLIGPFRKPHGRLACTIHLGELGGEPYLDISIMKGNQ